MCPQSPVTTSYCIEVSGWDSFENFFVEKTELDWSEEGGKKVHLRHPMRDGALIFVRLIHPTASGHSFPVAYQIVKSGPAAVAGRWQFHLTQLHPRPGGDAKESPTLIETLEGRRR